MTDKELFSQPLAACTHMRVENIRFSDNGRVRAERWYCSGCGTEFVPLFVTRRYFWTYIVSRINDVKFSLLKKKWRKDAK